MWFLMRVHTPLFAVICFYLTTWVYLSGSPGCKQPKQKKGRKGALFRKTMSLLSNSEIEQDKKKHVGNRDTVPPKGTEWD